MTLLAYAVTENEENTGAIFFADHAIVAHKRGASEFGDGDLTSVSCRRAPWADHHADTKVVPASLMIEAGWHFECTGCGVRIDSNLAEMAEPEDGRHKNWTPGQVVGSQNTIVFCDQRCHDEHVAFEVERTRRQDRAIASFAAIIIRRFPDAVLLDNAQYRSKPHAHATKRPDGRWKIQQVHVPFGYPGAQYGPASLDYDAYNHTSPSGAPVKPHFTCAGGDRSVFEAYAAATKSSSANKRD